MIFLVSKISKINMKIADHVNFVDFVLLFTNLNNQTIFSLLLCVYILWVLGMFFNKKHKHCLCSLLSDIEPWSLMLYLLSFVLFYCSFWVILKVYINILWLIICGKWIYQPNFQFVTLSTEKLNFVIYYINFFFVDIKH